MVQIAPSMLSADFLHLEKDVRMVNENADLFHLDIMDGTFVPNISYGFPVVEAIAGKAEKPLDAHLMIINPDKYVERFAAAGVKMLSFHYDAVEDPAYVIEMIRANGMMPGIAINPDIPVEKLFPYISSCGFMLIMSVFAGFGGQKFIANTLEKTRRLRELIERSGSNALIEIDGGINFATAPEAAAAGADVLVAGSAVFGADDPIAAISRLRNIN